MNENRKTDGKSKKGKKLFSYKFKKDKALQNRLLDILIDFFGEVFN